jgi:large subunit ribosomal protein L22
MKSYLKNYRQSPRKVRLVADLIRGKKVNVALTQLDMGGKRANLPMVKLIKSAVSNAKNNFNTNEDDLIIKEVRVDKGIVLKRIRPRAQGRAARINKRTSHISITLEAQQEVNKVSKVRRVSKEKKANNDKKEEI